jgi:hypothetical protein
MYILAITGVDDTQDAWVTKYTISGISVCFCSAIALVSNCIVSSNPEKTLALSAFGLFASITTILVMLGSTLQDSDTNTAQVLVNIGIAVCAVVTILCWIGATSFLDPAFLSTSKKVVVAAAFVTSLLATKNPLITTGRLTLGGTSAVMWTLLQAHTLKASYDQDKIFASDYEKTPLSPANSSVAISTNATVTPEGQDEGNDNHNVSNVSITILQIDTSPKAESDISPTSVMAEISPINPSPRKTR